MNPRIYKYIKQEGNREPCDVLESREYFSGDETQPKFIVCDESVNNYLVWDSYQEFIIWFAHNPTRRTLHEVILGGYCQKLKFDIDAKSNLLDSLIDMPEPLKPVKDKPIGDQDMDSILEEAYKAEMKRYTERHSRWSSIPVRER